MLVGLAGCGFGRSETVILATTWTRAECLEIDGAFQKWSFGKPLRLRWIALAPGDDVATLADRADPPDLILGASGKTLRRLKASNRLEAVGPPWWVARRSMIEVVSKGQGDETPAFDDFRDDPVSLAWAESILDSDDWAVGYGVLVRKAGARRSPRPRSFSAFGAFERGEVDSALMVVSHHDGSGPKRQADAVPWDEGLAILAGGRSKTLASEFVRHLAESGKIGPPPDSEIERPSGGETLLADLLGATLVDAQEDLQMASAALKKSTHSERAAHWIEEPPPWPPASVAKLLKSDNGMALAETLAAQIAPEPATRAWLLRSWLSPARMIDGAFLDELAEAERGSLLREPRFRNWLRSEWTAWARQRYRRVARLASAGEPLP